MGLMYLLDTNILSEPVKPIPNEKVIAKLGEHAGEYVTASTVWHELLYGIRRMDDSKRKASLAAYLEALSHSGLGILPYDKNAAAWLAKERARLTKQGTAVALADGEIASVAYSNNLVLVTRNVKDFASFDGLRVENWFE